MIFLGKFLTICNVYFFSIESHVLDVSLIRKVTCSLSSSKQKLEQVLSPLREGIEYRLVLGVSEDNTYNIDQD